MKASALCLALFLCGFVECRTCTAEAQPARAEARQALAVLCPSRVSLAPVFARAAERYGLPVAFLAAVSRNESNCNPHAVGKGGEAGLFQLRPGTRAAGRVSLARLDRPDVNAMLGAKYLASLLLLCGDFAGAAGVFSGRRTCRLGRASPYARRVMGFYELAIGKERRT